MKELPPDPKPWTPPPERWYDRHQHSAGVHATRTIIAMRLTVFDRLGIVRPGTFTISSALQELFDRCLQRHGDGIMTVWRERCSGLTPLSTDDGDQLFPKMLAELAKERGATR